MRTMITEDALNYINENSTQSKYIYDVLKNVESLLSPTFRKGYLVLENQNDNLKERYDYNGKSWDGFKCWSI